MMPHPKSKALENSTPTVNVMAARKVAECEGLAESLSCEVGQEMELGFSEVWTVASTGLNLLFVGLGVAVSGGWLKRRSAREKQLIYIEQDRDNLKKQNEKLKSELRTSNPQVFQRDLLTLRSQGEWDQAAELALTFSEKLSPAFGKAAETLAELNIFSKPPDDQDSLDNAFRFISIGLTIEPDSKLLLALKSEAEMKKEAIRKGIDFEIFREAEKGEFQSQEMILALANSGNMHFANQRYAAADHCYRHAETLALSALGPASVLRLGASHGRAFSLAMLGEYEEALEVAEYSLQQFTEYQPDSHENISAATSIVAGIHDERGKIASDAAESELAFEKAEHHYKSSRDILQDNGFKSGYMFSKSLVNLGAFIHERGRHSEAEKLLRQAVYAARHDPGEGSGVFIEATHWLAHALEGQGKIEDARESYRYAADSVEDDFGGDHGYKSCFSRFLSRHG